MGTPVLIDTYKPYDSGPGATVTEAEWRLFARHLRGDGVIRGEGLDMRVRGDGSGMNVKVDPGECWIRGHWGSINAVKTVPVVSNPGSQARRDLVVMRNNFNTNEMSLLTIEGSPGSTNWPSLQRTTGLWDIQLGRIIVPGDANNITSGAVTSLQHYTDGSCRYVVDSNTQQIPNVTDVPVDWDISQWDSSAIERVGLNTFKILRKGTWIIVPTLRFTPSSGTFYVYVARTGQAGVNRIGGNSGASDAVSCTAIDRFDENDTVQIWTWQNSGSTRNILNDFNQTSVAFWWGGP